VVDGESSRLTAEGGGGGDDSVVSGGDQVMSGGSVMSDDRSMEGMSIHIKINILIILMNIDY
jgi:hypothetical protein